jgi:hypothetical protein
LSQNENNLTERNVFLYFRVGTLVWSLSFLAEAQPRLNKRRQRHFLAEVHITFFKQKTFILYLDLHINNFFIVFLYHKTKTLLFAIQLLMYIIYGDRTIIGFVGLVVNLLTDQQMAPHQRRKKSYFSFPCEYTYVKLPFSLN